MTQNSVNELLHRKRGEQFRQQQNLLRSRTHISSSNLVRNHPTLPISLASLTHDVDALYARQSPSPSILSPGSDAATSSNQAEEGHGQEQERESSKCSGPVPPKSWRRAALNVSQDPFLTPSWRRTALAPLYASLGTRTGSADQRVLPFSLLCLLPLILPATDSGGNGSYSVNELRKDVLPWIPAHLRKELVRYTAVHAPLSAARLFMLYEEEGHADGEIMLVGPGVTIRDDYFIQSNGQTGREGADTEAGGAQSSVGTIRGPSLTASEEAKEYSKVEGNEDEADWERDDDSPKPLQVFAALSTRLSMSTILSLPPTLTHVALIHLTHPIYLHRLPQTCPLLTFLDLSYNDWLEYPALETEKSLARVDWCRWSHLQTLGWRKCGRVTESMLASLNKGRWDDVIVIQ